ncbi:BRO-N domain-containing protein [Virgibacillus sp. FSP13]
MNLDLAVKEMFEGNEVDIYWNEQNEPVMTIQQLAKSLEYSDRSGVDKIIQRNPYLDSSEFSVADKLSSTDGKKYDTRIFNEDGIYEVTMLSKKPKAKEFRAFVRKLLKSLRKGETQVVQPQSDYDKLQIEKMKAESRLMNARTRQAKLILDMQKNNTLSPVAVELLQINALETLTNNNSNYRPEVEKTYTASEIAKELGITPNKVGRIANANGLKTEEHGIKVLDKSRHSNKQVPSFRYNETGKQKIKELI